MNRKLAAINRLTNHKNTITAICEVTEGTCEGCPYNYGYNKCRILDITNEIDFQIDQIERYYRDENT